MTETSNIFPVTPDELYELWQREERDPTNIDFINAVRKLPPQDRVAMRRVFDRIVIDEETGDWIDQFEPVATPRMWFRGKTQYVSKVVYELWYGKPVPSGKSVSRIDGHLHSLHPGHLRLMSRGQASSIGMLRKDEKRKDAVRLLVKFAGLTREEAEANL